MGNTSLKYSFIQLDLIVQQQRLLELIKDNEQEVHYHLGKANIVADVLSRKAHCNYLPPTRLTREESYTRVLPDLALFNIILTPTLRDEIKAEQKNGEGMDHIRRRMQEGDPKVSYPVFMPKPSTHRMHDPRSIVPHIQPKVFTDNQMSRIKYNYYMNNVSKD
jgi:hypothetical protein